MTEDLIPTPERACPEAVAYDLMRDILLDDPRRPAPSSPEFRSYLLDLYAECLAAVQGERVAAHRTAAPRSTSPLRERDRREPVSPATAAQPT